MPDDMLVSHCRRGCGCGWDCEAGHSGARVKSAAGSSCWRCFLQAHRHQVHCIQTPASGQGEGPLPCSVALAALCNSSAVVQTSPQEGADGFVLQVVAGQTAALALKKVKRSSLRKVGCCASSFAQGYTMAS